MKVLRGIGGREVRKGVRRGCGMNVGEDMVLGIRGQEAGFSGVVEKGDQCHDMTH